jgi:hypothetical protein
VDKISIPFIMGFGMGLWLKFWLMGLSGIEKMFVLIFQMIKILFYLQILSFSCLL